MQNTLISSQGHPWQTLADPYGVLKKYHVLRFFVRFGKIEGPASESCSHVETFDWRSSSYGEYNYYDHTGTRLLEPSVQLLYLVAAPR